MMAGHRFELVDIRLKPDLVLSDVLRRGLQGLMLLAMLLFVPKIIMFKSIFYPFPTNLSIRIHNCFTNVIITFK